MAWNKISKPKRDSVVWNGYTWAEDDEGYFRCHQRGPMRKKRLHRMVYEHHKGPIPDGMEIDHHDQDKKNNLPENLRLVTAQWHGRKSREHRAKLEAEPWDEDPIKGGDS